jgi:hypothetical protein
MKKLLLALALCAFVSGPVFAATNEEGSAASEETMDMGQMDNGQADAHAAHAHGKVKAHAKADKKKKKMKKTAQKTTTTTTETSEEGGMDQAPEAN